MSFEFGQDVIQAGAGNIHLVERLHGREPRRAALVCLALVPVGRAHRRLPLARSRLMATMASAARAASPPLSASSTLARAQAWDSVLTVRIPLPSGSLRATDRSISARADCSLTISK